MSKELKELIESLSSEELIYINPIIYLLKQRDKVIDEFTKYRINREIGRIKIKLLDELKYNNSINDPIEDQYLNYIVESYSKLSLDSKAHLYGFTKELIRGEEKS